MPERLVVLTTTAGLGPAEILKAALQAAGIPVELSQEGAGAAYGLTVGPLGRVDLLVPASHAAEAEALLAEFGLSEPEPDADPDADE